MCNRYRPARGEELAWQMEMDFPSMPTGGHVGDPIRGPVFGKDIGPFGQGAFVRVRRETGALEEVVGQWGLIGWFAKTPQPPKVPGRAPILTNNARFETIATLATYKDPWARGQRCIIPAAWWNEPNWETGRNQWWRLRRSGPHATGLAGIWNTWRDKESGEVVESYSMVTLNADGHSLLSRMHRPDPKRPPHMQDKRAVVPLAPEAFDTWLRAPVDEAVTALVLPPEEAFEAAPEGTTPPAGALL